jgi:hypothetical protein
MKMPDFISISIFSLNTGVTAILEQRRSERFLQWKVLNTDKNIARRITDYLNNTVGAFSEQCNVREPTRLDR